MLCMDVGAWQGGLSPIAAHEEKTTGPQDGPPTSEPVAKARAEEECVLMDAEWVWGCMREDFPASTMTACLGLLRKTHPELATHVSHVAQSTSHTRIHVNLHPMEWTNEGCLADAMLRHCTTSQAVPGAFI